MSMSYANLLQSSDARAWAEQAAQQEYYRAQSAGASANQALDAAKFAWQKKLDEAAQTGKWNGIWNNPQEQWFTGQFGQWFGEGGAPTPGTQTQAVQNAANQYGLSQAGVTGVYYDPGQMTYRPGTFIRDQETGGIGQIMSNGRLQMFGDQGDFLRAGGDWSMVNNPDYVRNVSSAEYNQLASDPGANFGGRGAGTASLDLQRLYGTYGVPGQNQQTLEAQKQYWQEGFDQQQYEAQQRQLAQQNTQQYLQLLSNLRGPADWAKYQQVLGSTPQGMRDLYAAAMGQYTPGGGATTGYQPQAADLGTMQQQIGGYGQTTGMAGYNPQAQASGGQVWGSGIGIGGNQATPQQQAQATGNGTNMYGGQQQQYNLPAPNQISAQAWNNFTPSQQQLMLGNYEAAGWDKNDVAALYNQSLPKYAQNSPTAGTWRLQ